MEKLKSSFYRLNLFLIFLLVLSISLILFRMFLSFSVVLILFILVAFYWHRRLGEELIIYRLKQNSGRMKSSDLYIEFPKSAKKDLSSLASKGIVQLENEEVYLLKLDYACVFKDKTIK